MRAIAVILGLFVSFGITLKYTYAGIFTYIGLWYLNPAANWWGRMIVQKFGVRTALLSSLVLLFSFFIHKQKFNEHNRNIDISLDIFLYMILFVMMISSVGAVSSVQDAKDYMVEFFKRIMLFYLFSRVMTTNKDLRIFIWLNLLGCFYFGYEAVVDDYMEGGRLEGLGGPGSSDSEGLATHISIFIPFLGVYLLGGNKWERIAIILISPFIFNVLILCRTRGAFLAVIIAGIYFIIFCENKYRLKFIVLMVAGIIGFVAVADDAFWTRMQTLKDPTSEGSSASRIYLWRGAVGMVLDHPLGVGADNYRLIMDRYVPELDRNRPAHSTYFTMLAEQGFLGITIYSFFLLRIWLLFRKCRKSKSFGPEDDRRKLDIFGMECGFLTFLINQAVVNRFLTEAFYWIAAFVVVGLKISRNREQEQKSVKQFR